MRLQNVEWMIRLANSLEISANSAHLGIMLMDIVMFKDKTLVSKIQLMVPVCLLLAAKTIELDQRIPFIPKLKKYANSSYSIDAFRKAELQVLDLVDWNSQFSSTLEIVEFLMCQGVLFSSDEIDESGKWTSESPNNGTTSQKKTGNKNDATNVAKYLSPDPRESKENSYNSDTSTSGAGTSPENERTPKAALPVLSKENSNQSATTTSSLKKNNSLSLESKSSSKKGKVPVEKKASAILAHFEKNYVSLCELIIKDISFVKYEPKVVSAASIAFLRCVNKITPVWNGELEAITNLKYQQVSACFDQIHQKYSSRYQVVSATHEYHYNKLDCFGLNHAKSPSMHALKVENSQPKFNLTIRTNLADIDGPKITSTTNLLERNTNSSELKPLERRTIFNTQRSTVSSATINSGNNTYLKNDYKWKGPAAAGTNNTELPLRNPLSKQIFSNRPSIKLNNPTQDFIHYGRSNTTNASTLGLGSAGINNGSYLVPRRSEIPARDNFVKNYVSNMRLPRVQN